MREHLYLNNQLDELANIRSFNSEVLSASWMELEGRERGNKSWWYGRIHLVCELSGKFAICSTEFGKNLKGKFNTICNNLKYLVHKY